MTPRITTTVKQVLLTCAVIFFSQSLIAQLAPKTSKVRFQNVGNIPVKLYKTTLNNQRVLITEMAGNAGMDIDATVGDMFAVDINEEKVTHRTIYIVDPDATIFIYGNVAMKNFGGYGSNFPQLNYEPNMVGIDTTTLIKSNLVLSMKGTTTRIFEPLNATSGIDYESQAPYLIKTGFYYAGINLGVSTDKTKMSYGYSAFSSGWNLGVSGKFPAGKGGPDISTGMAYGETQSSNSVNTDVYAYNRTDIITHQVVVIPSRAYLDPIFADRVRRVKNLVDAEALIRDYGTHYPDMIFYGGELSSFVKMSSADYTKAKSMNLNLAAEVEINTPKTTTKGHNARFQETKKVDAPSSYGGKMDFGMTTNDEQRSLLEKSESRSRVIGGEYSQSGEYNVNEGNAVPIALTMRRLDELIDTKVFKDNTDPQLLDRVRALVQQATDAYIKAKIKSKTAIDMPPPKEYVITLTNMAVTGHIDDANANTKGNVTAMVYADNTLKSKIVHPNERFWNADDYSLDFRFSPNINKPMQTKLYFTQYADPVTGKFKPFYLNVAGNITEKDDLLWAPNGANFNGGSGPIDLNALNLVPGGPGAKRSLDLISRGNGSVRLSYTIERQESPFELPGTDIWTSGPVETIIDESNTPENESEFTLINAGGYAAKYTVSYTLEGQKKSYDSGDIPAGWKYKMPVPPNATNIKVEAFYHAGAWKSIFKDEFSKAADKCYKVVGTIFDAKVKYECD